MTLLRGALLGAGNIAQAGHLPAYAAILKEGFDCRIVAAADLCSENLRQLERLVPGIKTFASADELLREIRPDFVDICAPPSTHRELIERAAGAGCHIICEKPLTTTLGDAEAVAKLLNGPTLVFMPCHQYHYAPAWVRIRSILQDGEIGQLRSATITIERTAANAGNRHWNPAWRTRSTLGGGGILMDHGPHLFYQLRTLFGDPHWVAARIERRRHLDYEVEDSAVCHLDFGSAVARIDLTWAARRRASVHRYVGDAGILTCDEREISISGRSGARRIPLTEGFSNDSSHAAWYVPLLREFVSHVRRGDADRVAMDEAVANLRWLTTAYESARLGRALPFGGVDILQFSSGAGVGQDVRQHPCHDTRDNRTAENHQHTQQ